MAKIKGLDPLARAVLRTQSDARLVALAREGREAAFEEIVRRYRPALVAFAAAYAPPAVAEDVVQESLVSSWRAMRESSVEIRLRPWLYTIVRNRALNARRDARDHAELDETFDDVVQPPDIVLTREELARAVASVRALPHAQREALVRSALDGHAHDQIAAELGTSVGAVRQLIYRARTSLRHAAGLALPLPLLRALLEVDVAQAGVAAAGGGGAAAAGAFAATGGGSAAAKGVAVVAAAVAVAGSGVAIERAVDRGGPESVASGREDVRESSRDESSSDGISDASGTHAAPTNDGGTGSDDSGTDDRDQGDDRSGSDSDGRGSDDSGDGDEGDGGDADDSSGPSSSSGSGSDADVDDSSGGSGSSVSSGSGGSGSRSTGSGTSGSSSSGSGSDSSGSASDSSGTGSGSG